MFGGFEFGWKGDGVAGGEEMVSTRVGEGSGAAARAAGFVSSDLNGLGPTRGEAGEEESSRRRFESDRGSCVEPEESLRRMWSDWGERGEPKEGEWYLFRDRAGTLELPPPCQRYAPFGLVASVLRGADGSGLGEKRKRLLDGESSGDCGLFGVAGLLDENLNGCRPLGGFVSARLRF